jgi:hypothetical protein
MATSGYTDVTVANYIKLRFSWTAGTQNITSNYTPVSWKLQLISSNSSANISSSASKDYSVTVDGKTWSGTNTVGLSGGATKTLASGSKNIYHSSDGTKTFSYSFSQEFAITYSGSSVGTKTGSGSGTLNTIPRGSVLGAISSFTFGNAINIPITKYSSSFTDTLVISVGGTTIKTISDIDNGYDVSFTTTELNNIYAKLPSATKGTVTFKITTKNGSTTIGTSTKTATGTIPSSVKPTISGITLVEATSGLAAKFGAYIQNKSKITGTVNASAGSGSSISTYKTTINGSSYTTKTFTTGVLKTSGTNTISTTVTDKRGRTATYSTTFSVLAYSKPTINTFKVERCNADGTLNDEGINFKVTVKSTITSLNSKNDSKYVLQYKLSSVDTWTTLGNSLSGYTPNTNWVVTNIALNIDNVYDFRLTVSDYFESVPKSINVAESFTLMNFGPDGHSMAIGGVATETDTLDVKMAKTYLSTNSFVGGERRNDNEKNLFFQSTGDGEYNHNCKLYGANGASATSIGMWDSVNAHLIYRYLCSLEEFHFSTDMKILQGGKPILIEALFNNGENSGNFRLNNGFLIQFGKVSVTPTTANTTYNMAVKFPVPYSKKPNVFIIGQSSAPQNFSYAIGQGGSDTDAFDIYINRTTATATSFHWMAVGVAN